MTTRRHIYGIAWQQFGEVTGAISGSQVTLPTARGRVRSSSWTPPTSGNRVAGYKPATTGTPPEAAIFIVITVVVPPGSGGLVGSGGRFPLLSRGMRI